MNPILTYLLNHAPWLAVILIAVIATWIISKYHTKLESTRKAVDDLPCEKHKDDIRNSDLRYKELQRIVSSTNDMVVEINKWLMKFGNVLFVKSSAKKTIDDNIDFLMEELEKINPTTAYDVEEEALGFLLRNMGHEMFTDIKQFIYYSPDTIELLDPASNTNKAVKLSMQSIVKLMSIYLRDIYLSKHSDIQ